MRAGQGPAGACRSPSAREELGRWKKRGESCSHGPWAMALHPSQGWDLWGAVPTALAMRGPRVTPQGTALQTRPCGAGGFAAPWAPEKLLRIFSKAKPAVPTEKSCFPLGLCCHFIAFTVLVKKNKINFLSKTFM